MMFNRLAIALIISAVSFGTLAESKAGGLADFAETVISKGKIVFGKNDTVVSRDEFMKILRSDNYLCRDLNSEGECRAAYFGNRYFQDGFNLYEFILT